MKTKEGLVGFNKASRNFRNNHNAGSRLREQKELNFRADKRLDSFIYLS